MFALRYRGQTFYLVDTPGFDDTTTSNAEILQLVASFLTFAYKTKKHVDGVVYLHRITDNRVAGHATANIELFEKLCGNQGMKIVTLLTTMWDAAGNIPGFTRKDFEKHEEELISKHWSRMIKAGAQVRRSLNTVESLQAVLDGILTTKARQGSRRPVLRLAKELVDNRLSLADTGAGKVLVGEFEQSITKLEEQKKFLELKLNDDPNNTAASLRLKEVNKELGDVRDGAEKLRNWNLAGALFAIGALGALFLTTIGLAASMFG